MRVMDLSRDAYIQEPALVRMRQSVRWMMAVAMHAPAARDWFESLDSPSMFKHVRINPRIGLKPFRVYQSTRWHVYQRMKVIRETYLWASGAGHWFGVALLTDCPVLLASIPLGTMGPLEIKAGRDNRFRKEGEITLSLHLQGVPDFIMAMAFSAEILPGEYWGLRIGCIQGGPNATRTIVRDLTKAMHGMRPKNLLITVAQEIGSHTGVRQLLGVGGDIQAHLKKRAIYIPFFHRLDLDYDTMWLEAGGRPGSDGWFQLPLGYQRKTGNEIKPNKRALYGRRYDLLDDLGNQVRSRLVSGA